jgi:hypothetical protein
VLNYVWSHGYRDEVHAVEKAVWGNAATPNSMKSTLHNLKSQLASAGLDKFPVGREGDFIELVTFP